MDCEFKRIIVPARFGSFCLEYFNDKDGNRLYSVVYDCGSGEDEGKNNIDDAIEKYLTRVGAKVDLLFISHFHEDHINCIHKLPISRNTKVFVPYLKGIQHWNVYMAVNDINPVVYDGCISYLKDKKSQFILVDEFEDESQEREPIDISEYRGNEVESIGGISGNYIPSGQGVYGRKIYNFWTYTPFHVQEKSVYEDFIKKVLESKIIKPENLVNYDHTDDAITAELKRIYKEVKGQVPSGDNLWNASTMLLLSQKTKPNKIIHQRIRQYSHASKHFSCRTHCHSHCHYFYDIDCDIYCHTTSCNCGDKGVGIYTGDISLKYNSFWSKFCEITKYFVKSPICLFQIPHHGSKTSYNSKIFTECDICNAFINSNPKYRVSFESQIFVDAYCNDTPVFLVDNNKHGELEQCLDIII